MNLEGVDIFQAETIRTAAKIPAELRYRAEVRLLRRRRQIADRHVLDHAAAKRADLSHRKTSCLKGWASKTLNPLRQEAIYCDRSLTAASAASFNPKNEIASFGPSGPKFLQSQTRPQPENRLSISQLDVVHGQLYNGPQLANRARASLRDRLNSTATTNSTDCFLVRSRTTLP